MKRQVWLLWLAISGVVVSYFYIDQPLVWFLLKNRSRDWVILAYMAIDIVFFLTSYIYIFYGYFLLCPRRWQLTHVIQKHLVLCNAVAITYFIKEGLKLMFGRTWAATFICNNISLVQNHAYGFHWLTGNPMLASFPSGHVAVSIAFSTALALLYPAWRWICVLLSLLVVIGQVGMYYHFVSDVIAGVLLGYWIAVTLYKY